MNPVRTAMAAGLTLLCAWGVALAAPAQPSRPPRATATPAPINSCRSLPIQDIARTRPDLKELETVLGEFEASFESHDARRFRYLIHPAVKLDASKRDPIFESAFLAYGLEKPKLTRSALFEIHIPNRDNPVAECFMGQMRGVVGPETQYAALHTVLSASEQIRFLTIFAPIPQALLEVNKPKFKVGVVMLHTQVWTHGKKTAEIYLEEARKWSGLGEPMTAWVLAESALRLLDSNPYFSPREVFTARAAVAEYFGRMPSREAITQAFRKQGSEWDFEGFTIVFQANSVEPGAHFRLKQEEGVKSLEEKCRRYISLAFGEIGKGLKDRFHGVECLPYSPGEDGTGAPLAGTVFVKWSDFLREKH